MARTLKLTLRKDGMPAAIGVKPVATLDGVEVAKGYGKHEIVLSTTRATVLECRLRGTFGSKASATIAAGTSDVELEYTAPAMRGVAGELGPPGTTVPAGKQMVRVAYVMLAIFAIAVMITLVFAF